MCLDTNAHSQLWGYPESNRRGEEIEELILSNSLTVINENATPTWRRGDSSSIIDIALASPQIEQEISNWQVIDDFTSDHSALEFTLDSNQKEGVRSLKKMDWIKFDSLLPTPAPKKDNYTNLDLEIRAKTISRAIASAYRQACPIPLLALLSFL